MWRVSSSTTGRRASTVPTLSVEDVRDHMDEIRYTVPGGPADEMTGLFATIMTSGSD
jgi:hypothetical protein